MNPQSPKTQAEHAIDRIQIEILKRALETLNRKEKRQ